tara:strand:- start:683 stop:1435 length:753 start_codon:yes stop_codon:yes gene_type:complete
MTKITVNKSEFLSFLSVFTKGVPDLRLDCAGSRVTVEVAYASFYLRKYFFSVQVVEEGALHIADLEKAIKFMKATKEDSVVLRQVDTHKPLHIEAGGNKLQLPSTNDIESAVKAVTIRSLLKKCQEGGWASFGNTNLSTHSSLMTKDLLSFANMRGILAKDTDFKLRIHCGEEEIGIVAGKAASGRLFATIPATDTDGPATTVESMFSDALPNCLNYLDDGPARMHMGKGTIVIFEQLSTLLMVVDVGED